MGNRPINRRPWRKKPWAKKVRPTRWNAAFAGSLNGEFTPIDVFSNGAIPFQPPTFTLVSGQVDVEPWADDQEVTLDRTIGRLTFWSSADSSGLVHPPYLRVGMIVLEETEGSGGGTQIPELNLAEQETWEDFEWMWIWAGSMEVEWTNASPEGSTLYFRKDIDLDVRNRRKIGQSDELVIYSQLFMPPGAQGGAQGAAVADIRTILMSR